MLVGHQNSLCDDPLPKGVCSTMHVAALESWTSTNLALIFEHIQMFISGRLFFLLSWHGSKKKKYQFWPLRCDENASR